MDSRTCQLLNRVYLTGLKLLQVEYIATISIDEFSISFHRDQLTAELERIKVSCRVAQMEKLKSGISMMKTALNSVHRCDFATAKTIFPAVEGDFRLAFAMVTTFAEKILVTRLRILTALFIHHYFYPDGNLVRTIGEQMVMQNNCEEIFDNLTKLPVVVKALNYEFEGRSLFNVFKKKTATVVPRVERHIYLHEINVLNLFLFETLQIKAHFEVNQTFVNLIDCKPVDLMTAITPTTTQGPINKIWVFKNKLFTSHIDNQAVRADSNKGSGLFVDDFRVHVWDTLTFSQLGSLQGHTKLVICMASYQDKVFTGSKDHSILIHDIHSLSLVGSLLGHTDWVTTLKVTADRLYSCSDDGTLKVWEISTHTLFHSKDCKGIKCFALLGDRLFTGSTNAITLLDLTSFETLNGYPVMLNSLINSMLVVKGKESPPTATTVTSGRLYSTVEVSSVRNVIQVYDIITTVYNSGSSTTTLVHLLNLENHHTYYITTMHTFDNLLFTCSKDHNLVIFNTKTFEVVKDPKYPTSGYRDFAIKDGRVFAVYLKSVNNVTITLL